MRHVGNILVFSILLCFAFIARPAILAQVPIVEEGDEEGLELAEDTDSEVFEMKGRQANHQIPENAIRLNGLTSAESDRLSLWRTTHRCGINASYAYLKLRGYEASYENLLNSVPLREHGVAISDMAKICRLHGHDALVVKINPDELPKLLPAIVHCEEEIVTTGHYNVVVDVTPQQVCFIDGTTGIFKCVPATDFYEVWTGYALTASDEVALISDSSTGRRRRNLLFGAGLVSMIAAVLFLWFGTRSKLNCVALQKPKNEGLVNPTADGKGCE